MRFPVLVDHDPPKSGRLLRPSGSQYRPTIMYNFGGTLKAANASGAAGTRRHEPGDVLVVPVVS